MKAPKHLRKSAKTFFMAMLSDYEINDAGGLALLRAAAEAFERAEDARKLIKKEGAVIIDRFSQKKPHPAVSIERDARGQLISAIRALKLEVTL